MSASLPVAIASNQSTLPISAASLPLPTGASTNAELVTINSTLGSPFQAGGSIGNSSFGISGSLPAGSNAIGSVSVSNFPATQAISAASLPLPTGAATSANQTNASQKTQIVDGSGNVIASTSNALNVNVQNSISQTIAGTASANAPVYNVYSSTNITTSAYVQLVASTSNVVNTVHIFDSSGQAMIFAVGGSGSEVIQVYVPPGGDTFTLHIPAGSRIAYKALTATASAGYLLMSFLE
jgi:hypothetical protein